MGSVSTYRVRALGWYVAYQEELASLQQRYGRAGDARVTSRQEQITRIFQLRAEGRTQRDVAAIVGVSPGYVGKIERRILPAITRYRLREKVGLWHEVSDVPTGTHHLSAVSGNSAVGFVLLASSNRKLR